LRPVQDISVAAGRISAGNLSERINVEDTDSELGQLANLLNSTFGRLEAAFAQQKQFTADAAHELRTPLAVLISETQTTLARPRSAEEYRETVEACLDTAQRMRGLTHSLLELARFDAGQEPIEKAPFDLAALTQACVEQLEPLARERNVRLMSDLQPTTITGDAERIAQVITNLVSNAIHYNKDGGEVRVQLRDSTLTISDTGQGISEADLPHIFERFYRADRSRSRSEGRSGLGLAISKAILYAHGASVEVASRVDEGTVFTIRWQN
jgi:two-component system, OmpR family, sensor kinase